MSALGQSYNRYRGQPPKAQFVFNLTQFGEKTEKATEKKKEDARKKGQVVFSKDVNTAFTLLLAVVAMNAFGSYFIGIFQKSFLNALNWPVNIDDTFTIKTTAAVLAQSLFDILLSAGPILLVIMVGGVLLSYLQVGFLFTGETLKFKLDKLNPVTGLKQIFSIKSLVELLKNLLKIAILTWVSYAYISDKMSVLVDMINFPPLRIGALIWEIIYNLTLRICIILIVLGVGDYAYKRWQNERDLRMSKQEIKDEYKMVEGNPQIKQKIKEKQRQMAMSRMMQEVPKADVIITNPTHFAVAIKYDRNKYDAPYVIAKGQDLVAARIKKIATEKNIPVVENKPLARELYATVQVGRTVPESMYHAVAEVLAFIYKTKHKK